MMVVGMNHNRPVSLEKLSHENTLKLRFLNGRLFYSREAALIRG
jgi:hypothetical protein